MPEDEKAVQDTVPGEAPETPKETVPSGEKPSVPLTEERVAQLVSEAVEKAGRHFQSLKDKEVAAKGREVAQERQTRQALEQRVARLSAGLGEVDPDAARRIDLEEKERYYASLGVQENQRKFDEDFHGALTEFVTEMGLDPNDKRIDWGNDTTDYLGKQKKILASVGKIQRENKKATDDLVEQKIKASEARLRKELGADSVDTSISGGGGSMDGIPTNLAAYKKWVNDLSLEEWNKVADKANKMFNEGKIK